MTRPIKTAARSSTCNSAAALMLDERTKDPRWPTVARLADALVEAPDHLRASVTLTIPRIVPVALFVGFVSRLLDYADQPTPESVRLAAR